MGAGAITVSWMVFATALPSNASQTVTAIPYASFELCEQHMDRVLGEVIRASEQHGPNRRPVTIKPYCTTVEPIFWIRRGEF